MPYGVTENHTMRVEDYAKLIGRSPQFVRLACQQKQIPCIVLTHKKRRTYEILEVNNEKKESDQKQNHLG